MRCRLGYDSGILSRHQAKLREIILGAETDTWYCGTYNLPVGIAGTSLSACALEERPGTFWLYYHDTEASISEYIPR